MSSCEVLFPLCVQFSVPFSYLIISVDLFFFIFQFYFICFCFYMVCYFICCTFCNAVWFVSCTEWWHIVQRWAVLFVIKIYPVIILEKRCHVGASQPHSWWIGQAKVIIGVYVMYCNGLCLSFQGFLDRRWICHDHREDRIFLCWWDVIPK